MIKYSVSVLALLLLWSCSHSASKENVVEKPDSITTVRKNMNPEDTLTLKPYGSFLKTDIYAYSKAPLQATRNQIYAGGLTICWKEAGKALDLYPISLTQGPVWLKELNAEPLTYSDVDPTSIQIAIGPKELFKGDLPPYIRPIEAQDHFLLATVKLRKKLSFVDKVRASYEYNEFRGFSFQGSKVQYNYLTGSMCDDVSLYQIYDYKNDDNFILKMPVKDTETELILACVPSSSTLRATYDNVMNRMKRQSVSLTNNDVIAFPTVQFYTERTYDELKSPISNSDLHISQVSQNIKFVLNHEGLVIVEIDSVAYDSVGIAPEEPPKPKTLFFDQPYLIIVKQKNSKEPLYLMWIANDELMIKQ